MSTISLDFSKTCGKVKPMHAVNNGPLQVTTEQVRSNFEDYKAARIPYARNHDASFCADYGGEHTVDVHAIFPDFSKDPTDPASYDFVLTDLYLKNIIDAGTKVFYRLGTKIEHWCKKYGTRVPADFQKWAVICEHIIRHYNEGWADGFFWNIEYWEIWNEADGVKANGDQPNWTGTAEQYYEMYAVAATHLKKCFPYIKVGGPAMSSVGNVKWLDGFLGSLTKDGKKVPMDFFSWHTYPSDPREVGRSAAFVREKLEAFGYGDAENILNEINYLENWTDLFVATIEAIIGMRGAAFTAAIMCDGQNSPLDMLMYYDARPSVFNGLFDYYTCRPLKGYYPFVMYSKLYELKDAALCSTDEDDLYAAAARSGVAASPFGATNADLAAAKGLDAGKENAAGAATKKCAAMLVYFDREKTGLEKEISLKVDGIEKDAVLNCYLLDADHTMEKTELRLAKGCLKLAMKPDSVLLMEYAGA